jgi:hypothetical protein
VEELNKKYGIITTYAKRSQPLGESLLPSIDVLEVSNVFAPISRILGVVHAAAYVMQSVGAPAPYGTRAAKPICSAPCQLQSNEIVHGDDNR